MKKTRRLVHHTVRVAPKPSPRLTRRDLDSRAAARQPDSENRITRLKAQTACVQSENSRLEARVKTASAKSRQSVQTQEQLKGKILLLDTRISALKEEVEKRRHFVAELTEIVNQSRDSTQALQTGILSYSTYEKLNKDLRQHQLKRNATAKRLKEAIIAKRETDFANPTEILSIYKEDIATLLSNNTEIQKQITAMKKQVDVYFAASDLEKYETVLDGREIEMKELLKQIRRAKRKDGNPAGADEDDDETAVHSFLESPIIQRVRFTNPDEKDGTESILTAMDKEIESKTKTKQDLVRIAQKASEGTHTKVANVLSTAAISDAESFAVLQKKIHKCVRRLEQGQKQEAEEQLDKLRAEMTTVCATLQSEEMAAYREARQHAEYDKQLRSLDQTIEAKKNEIEATKRQGEKMQCEITEVLKKRSDLRKEIDEKVEKKSSKIQKLVSDLTQYRVKYEDVVDRLRLAEAELTERKQRLQEVNASEEKIDYEHLTQKKEQLAAEVATLRNEMKHVDSIVDTFQSQYERKQAKKEKLTTELTQYKRTIDIDEDEVNSLERYADRITELLRETKQKRK